MSTFQFYEFFCGGGMARAGLGANWQCLFANDFDPQKAESYQKNWSGDILKVEDVAKIGTKDIQGQADLIWASFPCQDLSVAGPGEGLKGDRSGAFWPFWRIVLDLKRENRSPNIIVLENVCGALTSRDGEDFSTICRCIVEAGFKFGALLIDAADFVPQSRPRLFFIAVQNDLIYSDQLIRQSADAKWHTSSLISAYSKLDDPIKNSWIWWSLPHPPARRQNLIDIIVGNPDEVAWHTVEETERLIELMSPKNLAKLRKVQNGKERKVGTIYRRMRKDSEGKKIQRAEVRFDEIAGCLRTPGGGSSRQIIMLVEGESVRSRLLSSREAAKLMGLPDTFMLPAKYNEAYHLLGDGLVVPVVNHVATHLLEPILSTSRKAQEAA
jgi:DNA (cytosine-5)-methyltransferase 1